MEGIVAGPDGSVTVTGTDRTLTYTPRSVELSDGTSIAHESRGGTLSSVWAGDLGDRYVEVVHLGDGPEGGELVLVVPSDDVVALGDLVGDDPSGATPQWAAAIDLALGLMTADTHVQTTGGPVSRDEVEDFHQRLLGVLHG